MSTANEQRELLLPGHSRVRSVWIEPAPAGVRHPPQSPPGIPASAGHWEERGPAVHARRTVTVPVVVGPELRIF